MGRARTRRATAADVNTIVDRMRRYDAEDSTRFVEARGCRAVQLLVDNEQLCPLADDEVVGYLAVTLGFGLEFRGRDAVIDEIYLLPSARGRGHGSKAIERRGGVRTTEET